MQSFYLRIRRKMGRFVGRDLTQYHLNRGVAQLPRWLRDDLGIEPGCTNRIKDEE